MMKIKLLLLALVYIPFGFSQTRTCGMEDKMNELMFNPVMKQKYDESQKLFDIELNRLQTSRLANNNTTFSGPVRIPVAVHFPNAAAASAAVRTCLRALAQNQINILNADYNGMNADMATWTNVTSPNYPGINTGSLNIQMELATQNHPPVSGLNNGEVAVTFGYNYGSGTDWDTNWAGYLNIVVKNLGGGTLGYAYLASSPTTGSAVFISRTAFGAGSGCLGYVPGAPYNLGRTLTHELGHYFNLNHTFDGCNNTNCNTQGDRVCDTPPLSVATGGCPAVGTVFSCESDLALTMNYMDYTNDACMYMFTAGQAQRQQAHFNTILSAFNQTTLSSDADFISEKTISIYPNPNKGAFTIQFSDYLENFSVQVFDQSGRIVFENKYENQIDLEQQISLNSVASGIYFVKVSSETGTVNKKIVVQ